MHVAGGRFATFGSGAWNDMGGIAKQQQSNVLHWRENKPAQGCDALFRRRPARDPGRGVGAEADGRFFPEPLGEPFIDLVRQWYADAIAAADQIAYAGWRKAALVICLDQFVVARRRIGQDPQPAEWIFAQTLIDWLFGDSLAAGAVKYLAGFVGESDARRIARDIVQHNIRCSADHLKPAFFARIHHVTRQFGLAKTTTCLPTVRSALSIRISRSPLVRLNPQ